MQIITALINILRKIKHLIFPPQRKKIKIEIKNSLEQLKKFAAESDKPCAMFFGDFAYYDKGILNFINTIADKVTDYNWILLSEASRVKNDTLKAKMAISFIKFPLIFDKVLYKKGLIEHRSIKGNFPRVNNVGESAIEALANAYPEVCIKDIEKAVSLYYEYLNQFFDIASPALFLLWNQFNPFHAIVEDVVKERKIKIKYMEFGSLPGTFALESNGQMGESLVTLKSSEFKKLPVDECELENARSVWDYLYRSRLNRNEQVISDKMRSLFDQLRKKGRPIVFFAGHSEIEAGTLPYTERVKQFHSPIFKTNYEALSFIGSLAEQHGWTVVYKPHPLSYGKKYSLPPNINIIEEGDINDFIDLSDVTVTILSQTAYISLIRHKPVVMLGYIQLKDKGCTYEAFSKDTIEASIKCALTKGITDEMQKNFVKHIAQLNKYYLYDNLVPRDLQYGMKLEKNNFNFEWSQNEY